MSSNNRQKTIAHSVEIQGLGLFTGEPCTLSFRPAKPNTGIAFARIDVPETVRVPAQVANVAQRQRRTTLRDGTVAIETIEHVMSAISGLGLDNILVEMTAAETPGMDGSPRAYVDALLSAGIEEQDAEPNVYVIDQPVTVSEGEAMLAALPGDTETLDILYDLDYSTHPSIGRQVLAFRLGADDYVEKLSSARTFLLKSEAESFRAKGMGTHLTERDLLVMGEEGPINNELRFPDEHVRHKICDLVGDLALFGAKLRGRIVAYKSGHSLNHQLVRMLVEQMAAKERSKQTIREPLLDIRHIQRILPHRYPFLMVDRVIELDGDRRAVGIKNVSINEPYFQGHYPGQPIMPGVLILESMAQLSGVLLSRRLEHTGKIAVLLSMDRVKMRRPVLPGDQLILEAESLHVRSRTGHCKCRAMVGDQLTAEAEIKFMLVDADPV